MSTQSNTIDIEKVNPKDLQYSDKIIVDGQRVNVDHVYPAGNEGNYAVEVSAGGYMDTVIIPAGETVERVSRA